MSKLRVLFLVQLPPPLHGVSIMNQLLLEDEDLGERFNYRVLPIRFSRSIHELRAFSIGKLWAFFRLLVMLIRDLIRFKPDSVYFTLCPTGMAFWRDCLLVAVIKCFPVRIVFHLHARGIKARSGSIFQRVICKGLFNNSKVILLSRLLYWDIADVCSEINVLYTANGIECILDDPKFNAIDANRFRKGKDETVSLLFLGHMMESKGPLVLLEACRLLRDWGVRFQARFIGAWFNTEFKKDFYQLVEKYGLENNVNTYGEVFGEQKYCLLAGSDIFVHPTLDDAFPLVLLEAMQFGLAVIATRVGAIPEIVDEHLTGIVVPKSDFKQLAAGIGELIADPNLRLEMGRRGREKFLSHYTAKAFVQNVCHCIVG